MRKVIKENKIILIGTPEEIVKYEDLTKEPSITETIILRDGILRDGIFKEKVDPFTITY